VSASSSVVTPVSLVPARSHTSATYPRSRPAVRARACGQVLLGGRHTRFAVRSSGAREGGSPWNRARGLGVMLPVRVRGTGTVDSAAAHRLAFHMTLCSSAARLSRGSMSRSARRFSSGLPRTATIPTMTTQDEARRICPRKTAP
jgi:hypothetical protein